MNSRWLLVKYMPDLRRREPMNIGVILFPAAGVPIAKFRGEDETGDIDGRRVARLVGSVDNYKAWVAYWRRVLRASPDPSALLGDRGESYFAEFGGERLLGNDTVDPGDFLSHLFRELVDEPPPSQIEVVEPRRAVDRAIIRLGIDHRITRNPEIIGRRHGIADRLSFDYRYVNGINVLMKRVHIGHSSDAVHAAAWAFEQARQEEKDTKLISLISHAAGADTTDPIALLHGVGADEAIDESDEDNVTAKLQALLHLPTPA